MKQLIRKGRTVVPGSYRLVVQAGTSSTSSYVATSGPPNVLATLALTHLTGTILPTPIVTLATNGVYRVTATALSEDTQCLQTYVISAALDWTDSTGPRSVFSTASISGAMYEDNLLSWSVNLNAAAGTKITYEVDQVFCQPYDLSITVEQVQ